MPVLEWELLSLLPEKMKLNLLAECIAELTTKSEHDTDMSAISKRLRLAVCILKDLDSQGKVDGNLLASLVKEVPLRAKNAEELCSSLLTDFCYPLINSTKASTVLLVDVFNMVDMLVPFFVETEQEHLIQLLADKLTGDSELELEKKFLYVECLSHVYSKVSDEACDRIANQLMTGIQELLHRGEEPLVGNILTLLLPKISERTKENGDILMKTWTVIAACFESQQDTDSAHSRAFLLLCGMVDIFFPPSGCHPFVVRELLGSSEFWTHFQLGFMHSDLLTRKRVLYVFRRILAATSDVSAIGDALCPLFNISHVNQEKMANVWLEFMLLIETLEEKQIHVIQPVLDRFSILINATTNDSTDTSLLHMSWVLLLFRRMASHESVVVRRWSMSTLLKIDVASLTSDDRNLEFLCGPFVKMLADSSVYYKPPDLDNTQKSLQSELVDFICCVHNHLTDRNKSWFWASFIENLSAHFWNGGVLVFISRALAQLPECHVLGTQSVGHFRKLLTLTVLAHDSAFRSAIRCFLTKMFFNFIDLSQIGVDSLLTVLGCHTSETLRRGSRLWMFLVQWLKNVDSDWKMMKLIPDFWKSIVAWLKTPTDLTELEDDSSSIPECQAIVRLLLLVLDVGVDASYDVHGESALSSHLAPVLDVLKYLNKSAYQSEVAIHQSMLLLLTLFKEVDSPCNDDQVGVDKVCQSASKLASSYADEVLAFVVRKFMSIAKLSDCTPIALYLALTAQMAKAVGHQMFTNSYSFQQLCQHYFSFVSDNQTKDATMPAYVGLELIGFICTWLPTSPCDICRGCSSLQASLNLLLGSNWLLKTNVCVPEKLGTAGDHDSLSLRRLRTNMLSSQWVALSWFVRSNTSLQSDSFEPFIKMAEETLDIADPDTLVVCLDALVYILPKVEDVRAATVLRVIWSRVKDLTRNSSFWSVYSAFLPLAFQKDFLQRIPENEISTFLSVCFDEILEKSEEKSGMLNLLVHRICHDASQEGIDLLDNLVPAIVKALAFGPVSDKAKRFNLEVERFLRSLPDHFSREDLKSRVMREESYVRVELLSILAHLDPSCPHDVRFGRRLVMEITSSLQRLIGSKQRSYANCTNHRTKHRLLVALMILEPFIQEDQSSSYAEFLMELIFKESQPSLRFLGEWMFIRLVKHQPDVCTVLWNALESDCEKKPSVLCSLLVITVHVTELILANKNAERKFLHHSLTNILVWCMSSNFNVRAFAQAALIRLWTKISTSGIDEPKEMELSLLQNVNSYMANNKESFWAAFQLLDSHYCFNYDPENDFCLEALVCTIPRLSGMTEEEWISTDMFSLTNNKWNLCDKQNLPLKSETGVLGNGVGEGWKIKTAEPASEDRAAVASVSGNGNVQKKLIPWQSLIVTADGDSQMLHPSGSFSRATDGLILVGSLIDRIPNLGGLCRTSEIFAVSKFVIGSKRYLEDKAFETLSVTSHKWIDIEEVLPNNLLTFLLEAKKSGYTLVGAEQTAKSQCLSKFTFPKRTLLLLGNERCGIPVEILQVLDVCVEIPQSGMIRSLNVHVTGALLVWEYYKQWNLSNSPLPAPSGGDT